MYAFQLPRVIPPAGTPGGPPLPENYRDFANGSFSGDSGSCFSIASAIHNSFSRPGIT